MRLRLLLLPLVCGLLHGQDPSLKDAFLQAKALWATQGDREAATLRFESVVSALHPQRASLTRDWLQILGESYNWLAVLDDRSPQTRSQAQSRLQSLLEMNPDFELDRALTSQRLQALFERLRGEKFALVRFTFTPEGGRLSVDGQATAPAPTRHLPFGTHTLVYTRPGYAPAEQSIELGPKDTKSVAFSLTRVASTLTFHVHPTDVEVLLDGKPLGMARGHAGPEAAALAAPLGLRPEELSAPFVIPELLPGPHQLELRAPCHRPKVLLLREDLATPAADHTLESIRLEPSQGTLTVTSAWPGGELWLSGRSLGPLPVTGATVCSGTYDLLVRFPGGGFAQPLVLKEGEAVSLEARPKPRLAFLGLEGGDFTGRARFEGLLAGLGARLEQVAFLAPSGQEAPAAALARLKATHDAELVLLARPLPDPVIHRVELVVATLDGEEDRMVVKPLERDPLDTLVARLNAVPPQGHPSLGLSLLDLPGSGGPWVLEAPESLQQAGLQVGRPMLQVDGKPLLHARDLPTLLTGAQATATVLQEGGSPLTLPVVQEALEVPLGSPLFCYPAVLAQLRLQYAGARGDQANLLKLNQGLVLMQFRRYDKAIELLRDARLSTVRGVCQGTLDYYTGVCFLRLGPTYQTEAAQAFRQALKYPQATLLGPDGPLVTPLARQALEDLK